MNHWLSIEQTTHCYIKLQKETKAPCGRTIRVRDRSDYPTCPDCKKAKDVYEGRRVCDTRGQ